MTDRQRPRRYGDGSVFQRADGRWSAELFVDEALTGRRVRRTVYGKSAGEVEAKLVKLRERADQALPVTPAGLSVGTYLREWLTQIAAPRVRPNTLKAYRLQVERYLVPGLGSRPLGKLTARDVRRFVDRLRSQGVGVRTIQYVHATLRAALEDAVREEVLARNVAKLVRVPRPAPEERRPLDVDEVRQLLKATREHRLHAMFVVFALLGMRRSEVLGLQWRDVDLDARVVRVERGLHRLDDGLKLLPPKTKRSRRTVPLPAVVVQALTEHKERQEHERQELGPSWPATGFVFTTPIGSAIDPRNCTRIVLEECERAGVRRVRLHDFRHGCVSVLLSLGVPPRTAMEIVGHSTLEMTMTVYGHVSLDDMRTAMDRLGELVDEGAAG